MSGRYAFSLPDPRQRDGWFRIGQIDMTTTAILVASSIISWFVWALAPDSVYQLAFSSVDVRAGEVWRLVTWPFVDVPSIWGAIGLFFFWYFGHMVEEQLGRKPYTWLLAAMAVVPAILVSLIGVANEGRGQWAAYSLGVGLLSLGIFTIFALDRPDARFFFGIPAWVLAVAYVGITMLQLIGVRAWAQLLLMVLIVVVGLVGARQRGLCEALTFIPRWSKLAPSYQGGPYGEVGSAKKKKGGRFGRKGKGKGGATATGPTVVAGPWAQDTSGITPLEQAELDVLLDRIGEGGIDSLSSFEKARLNELSKKMRES